MVTTASSELTPSRFSPPASDVLFPPQPEEKGNRKAHTFKLWRKKPSAPTIANGRIPPLARRTARSPKKTFSKSQALLQDGLSESEILSSDDERDVQLQTQWKHASASIKGTKHIGRSQARAASGDRPTRLTASRQQELMFIKGKMKEFEISLPELIRTCFEDSTVNVSRGLARLTELLPLVQRRMEKERALKRGNGDIRAIQQIAERTWRTSGGNGMRPSVLKLV
ncbi:uncharacterized protein MYCGRDRAFT_89515 [Zymoseptoria tritici IPO323]|uniref:Uncharacterized protein n=1 Tax=Zymoseptoria tritici (strain CBS 115943 / IPO323) TaxID=336722 RepID=F9WWL6_ZYMTI|nr:uncharacterized protein MYCGRDRAFT_89515 [Zymoseptoria tritici IPO323]EGP91341.1 hypothetical protein MYCGRDRAFT_89515 [Zymoseptoria tritici IPO323]